METLNYKEIQELEVELMKQKEIIEESLDIKMYKSMKEQVNELIDENMWIKKELGNLQKEYDSLQSKYIALSTSKLGKITLKYWDFKRKFK